jgi:leucyl aminopeptidase
MPTDTLSLWPVIAGEFSAWLEEQSPYVIRWVRENGFKPEAGHVLAIPRADGTIAGAVVGLGHLAKIDDLNLWHGAPLPDRLPAGRYSLKRPLGPAAATQFTLGWLMGSYRFARYRTPTSETQALLVPPETADITYAETAARAITFARDLINTPANDMGPGELAQAAIDLASEFSAGCTVLTDQRELRREYPLVNAVGAASPREPRLIDIRWGPADAPRVTLIGKGVCFDSGGLNLKTGSLMELMKKDMGGAACVLALARLIMVHSVRVNLRVIIPAVENSVSGSAIRPGDVVRSRKGLTVEITNTDAEGRLILADALAEGDQEKPDLLIDLATLTGAARRALGPELPAAYSTDDALLAQLHSIAAQEADPIWPMPLWEPYADQLKTPVADLLNAPAGTFAGSVTAALFLKRFVTQTPAWLHVDIYAWNPKERPGRPVGAEPQCVRALYRLIRARFG